MDLKVSRKTGNSGRNNLELWLLGVKFLILSPIGESIRGLVVASWNMLDGNFTARLRHLIYDTAAWSNKAQKHAIHERNLTLQSPDEELGVASY